MDGLEGATVVRMPGDIGGWDLGMTDCRGSTGKAAPQKLHPWSQLIGHSPVRT
jgi:hypothetical protein